MNIGLSLTTAPSLGGISLLSYEHGLGSDNVIDYEIVTSSGKIIHANEVEHSDLWWALKLGSTNYGIVTAFTVKTFPVGPIWGGIRIFSAEDSKIIIANFAKYAEKSNGDPTTGITDFMYSVSGDTAVLVILLAYRTHEPEPDLYKNLVGDAQPIQDNMSLGSIMDYMNKNVFPSGFRAHMYARNLLVDGKTHFCSLW